MEVSISVESIVTTEPKKIVTEAELSTELNTRQ